MNFAMNFLLKYTPCVSLVTEEKQEMSFFVYNRKCSDKKILFAHLFIVFIKVAPDLNC